jgi:hypothetical protein
LKVKGDYWSIIAHIPEVYISWDAVDSSVFCYAGFEREKKTRESGILSWFICSIITSKVYCFLTILHTLMDFYLSFFSFHTLL